MLKYFYLCKHLTEQVERKQPLDRAIGLIIEAVKAQEFEIVEEQVDTLPKETQND